MMSVKVSDLGWHKCNYIATGDNEREIFENVMKHVRRDHFQFVKNISLEKKREIREKIKNIILKQNNY